MKRKLTCGILLLLILCAATGAHADDNNTFAWTSAASLCAVSDVYYYTADGQKAFVAGGLTDIPEGTEVYLTLDPLPGDDALYRLDPDCYVAFGDGRISGLAHDDALDSDDNGGVYHFTMQQCADGRATLVAECTPVHRIVCSGENEYSADGWQGAFGTIAALNDVGMLTTSAAAGEPVTLSITPGDTYALYDGSVTVRSASGDDVQLTASQNDEMLFTMPDDEVTVIVNYAKAEPVTLASGLGCAISGEYAYAGPARAFAGSQVTLSVYPENSGERIRFNSLAVTDSDGSPALCKSESYDSSTGAKSFTFSMPKGGVILAGETGASHVFYAGSGLKVYAADTITPLSTYCAGDIIYVYATVPQHYGLIDDRLTITSADGCSAVSQRSISSNVSAQEYVFEITAPDCDMGISAETGVLYTLSTTQAQGLGVIQTYPSCYAVAGSNVHVAMLPAEGWHTVPGSLAVCESGTHTAVATIDGDSFVMPASNCEITAQFEAALFGVKLSDSDCFKLSAHYSLSASGTTDAPVESGVPAGALVSVSAMSASSCPPAGIFYDMIDSEGNTATVQVAQGGDASFIMPACGISLYAVCADHGPEGDYPGEMPQSTDAAESGLTGGQQMILPCAAIVVSDNKNLRLREQCSTDSGIAGNYPDGSLLTVLALNDDGTWANVRMAADGKTGWMKFEFLRISGAEEQPSGAPQETETPALNITVILPELDFDAPEYVKQQRANENVRRVFRHIILL